ncbi:hypothetical protein J4558_21465 [Leptolyngbya sp. 15MV]|nr:hypothetical protein J4558_21465 [Leptolyngbya sp. 15MV]
MVTRAISPSRVVWIIGCGQIIAILIVAALFIPAFYRHDVATVYQLIDHRFGRDAARACSWAFLLGRVLANGSRLFIAAIAVSMILFGNTDDTNIAIGIAIMAATGLLYTFFGGIRAVIWTDVIQTIVFVGAALVAIAVLLHRIPAPIAEIVRALAAEPVGSAGGSKLTVISLSTDPARTFTLWTALICFTIFNLAAYGTDHDLAQRTLTCRSAAAGSRSAITAIFVAMPITLLFMIVGLLLFVLYRRPDLMASAAPTSTPAAARDVFLHFIIHELPPGVTGIMIAGLLAAALSTLTSSLNAMASSFVNDTYRHLRPGRDDRHYLLVGRGAMIVWALAIAAVAILSITWYRSSATIAGQTLLDFALTVMTFAYAGLAAVFVAAIFTRRGSGPSAIAALVVGAGVVLAGQPAILKQLTDRSIAWPWIFSIAFAAALITCLLGRTQPARPAPARSPSQPASPAAANDPSA